MEDFVRWHSPPDWTECEQSTEAKECSDGGETCESWSTKGHLSRRMQKEGAVILQFIVTNVLQLHHMVIDVYICQWNISIKEDCKFLFVGPKLLFHAPCL